MVKIETEPTLAPGSDSNTPGDVIWNHENLVYEINAANPLPSDHSYGYVPRSVSSRIGRGCDLTKILWACKVEFQIPRWFGIPNAKMVEKIVWCMDGNLEESKNNSTIDQPGSCKLRPVGRLLKEK